jgi:hypothetical protein
MDLQEVLECEASPARADGASIDEASTPETFDDEDSSDADESRYTYVEDRQTSRTPQLPICHCSHCLAKALGCIPAHNCSNTSTATHALQESPKLVAGELSTIALGAAILAANELDLSEQLAPDAIPSMPTTILELIRQIQLGIEDLKFEIDDLKVCVSFQNLEIAT